jgi:polysaccharide deacetylase family sporulation protein PdaB
MIGHESRFFRRSLPRNLIAAGILALLAICVESSLFGVTPAAAAQNQPQSAAATLASSLVRFAAHGNTNLHEIALTFDDGPALDTPIFLNILRKYHVSATFFMLGEWVQRYPDLARAVLADGHAIGDHTWDHPDLTRLSTNTVIRELTSARSTIQRVTGITPTIFRPPYGAYNYRILNTAYALQFSTILWSCDPADWSRPGVNAIINRVLNCAKNGSIILMHDGGGNRSQTIAALPTIIERLQARGFTFVTIPQMLLDL